MLVGVRHWETSGPGAGARARSLLVVLLLTGSGLVAGVALRRWHGALADRRHAVDGCGHGGRGERHGRACRRRSGSGIGSSTDARRCRRRVYHGVGQHRVRVAGHPGRPTVAWRTAPTRRSCRPPAGCGGAQLVHAAAVRFADIGANQPHPSTLVDFVLGVAVCSCRERVSVNRADKSFLCTASWPARRWRLVCRRTGRSAGRAGGPSTADTGGSAVTEAG